MVEREYVQKLFGSLKSNPDDFFKKVSDNVHWTVMGTHPLAGRYFSKEDFLDKTFARLNKLLKKNAASLEIDRIFVDGDYAIVEMKGYGTALNGKSFDNVYCWIAKFEKDMITEVKAYVDSALVQQIIDENE